MLSTEHCLRRAEQLRLIMLSTPDAAEARRIRGYVVKYRVLAERAKETGSPPLNTIQGGPDHLFGKSKGNTQEDKVSSPAQQSQNLAEARSAASDLMEIFSSIGPGVAIVGKTVRVFGRVGRVEGELHASIVQISASGQMEGDITADELAISGRFKGTIRANRVTLGSCAIIEGEIFLRSLAMEENARFEGISSPEENSIDTAASAQVKDPWSCIQHVFERYRNEKEHKMFGKSKGSSYEKDKVSSPAQQSQNLAEVRSAASDSTEISSIGPGMTIVGKISVERTVNVFGRVEGELQGSIVRIHDGGQVEGAIVAQELTIGGRFKGTIHANRVMLNSSAVVEGDISYRSLAIEENAWFQGMSRPQENLIDTSASAQVKNPPSHIQLVPTDQTPSINGALEKEVGTDTATG